MSESTASQPALTELLHAWQQGNSEAFAQIFELMYTQLRQIAALRLGRSSHQETWTPTELLHEAYLRVAGDAIDWRNRAHFFASMSLYIRSALVDHARARRADKRANPDVRISLSDVNAGEESVAADILALEQALSSLQSLDSRCADVLHLSCFAGLERSQIAEVMGLSVPSVDRDLRFARAWLNEALERG